MTHDAASTFSGLMIDALVRGKNRRTTIDDTAYIVQRLRPARNAKLLDVPCGIGRISVELAGYGFSVTGVDLSPAALAACQQLAEERGVNVAWEQRDMRDLPWVDHFDGAICWWDSFGFLDEDGNAAHLKAIYQALRPGGRLVLETHVAESIFAKLPARTWEWLGDLLVMEELGFDHEQTRLLRRWTFMRDGVTERKLISVQIYTYRALIALLKWVGFTQIETSSHRSDEPFRINHTRLNVVATK
ncbi:MAG: class I SAM-dependent methyltransferase [Anaerolineae bacterium]|nr:class I SAM-dependent methyltransferase [Anaerolineae bacterium]